MKKILFFTDTHLQEDPISSRKDDYLKSILTKIEEVSQIANDENVDYVLFGGDFFTRPSPSYEVTISLTQVLKKFNSRPIIGILGNHDIEGRNPETYNRKAVKMLEEAKVLKIIKEGEIFPQFDEEIEIVGINYKNGIDDNIELHKIKKRDRSKILIVLVHAYLLPFKANFPHIPIEEISKISEGDIFLVGHYHDGYGIREINGKIFVSPGSIARDSKTQFDRIPQIALLNINNGKIDIKLVKLKNVKRREEIELKEERVLNSEFSFLEYFKALKDENLGASIDPEKILNEILSDRNIEDEVKEEVKKRYYEAKERIYKKY
ncbi:MAG: metallophosphoesterase [Caldisericia bacterium]|jgi:DNA repair exonuclease SbcCD nuclease subunit|nr:metallophosphoesterase [Caldisericia bacterium]